MRSAWFYTDEKRLKILEALTPNDLKHQLYTFEHVECAAILWSVSLHEAEQRLAKGEIPCLKQKESV